MEVASVDGDSVAAAEAAFGEMRVAPAPALDEAVRDAMFAEARRRHTEDRRTAHAEAVAHLDVPLPENDLVVTLVGRAPAKVLREFEAKHGVSVVSSGIGQHSHPICALERDTAEEMLCRVIRRSHGNHAVVLDVGGNSSRHRAYGRRTWHAACGNRAARDALREREPEGSCEHDALECDCCDPTVVTFVFAHYYNSVDEIATLVARSRSGVGYLVCHRYEDVAGNCCAGEVQYEYTGDGNISVRVGHEPMSYAHDGHAWLLRGWTPLPWDPMSPLARRALCATHLFAIGDTHVYKLGLDNCPAGLDLAPWHVAAAGREAVQYSVPSLSGLQEGAYRIGGVEVEVPRVEYFGPLSFVRGSTTRYLPIPANVVPRVALQVTGRPRNAETYAMALRHATSAVARVTNYPDRYKPEAVLFATYAALTLTVETEVGVLTALGSHGVETALHASLLADPFQEPRWYQWAAVGSSVTVLLGGYAVVMRRTPARVEYTDFKPAAWTPSWGTVQAIAALPLVAFAAGWSARLWLRRPRPKPRVRHAPEVRTGPWDVMRPPLPAPLGAIELPLDSARARDAPALLTREAICFPGVRMGYYTTDDVTVVSAVTNRLTLPVAGDPAVIEATWRRITAMNEPLNQAYRRAVAASPVRGTYGAFLKHQAGFPRAVQRERAEARDRVMRDGGFQPSDFANSLFIKVEKVPIEEAKFDDGAVVKWPAPRTIVVHKPAVHAFKGPIIMQASQRLKDAERALGDGTQAPGHILLAQHSAEVVGEWFTHWYEVFDAANDGAYFWSGDGDKFDARWTEEARDSYNARWIRPLDLRHHDAASFGLMRVRGYARTGHKVDAGVRQGSGADDTWFANTLINVDMATDALGPAAVPNTEQYNWAGAFGGDDVLLIMSRGFVEGAGGPQAALERIQKGYGDAGFPFAGVISQDVADAEFCSRRFYPTKEGGFKPGAKLGRALARGGYALNTHNAPTRRATALQQLQDNAHVPFLREYWARVVELTVGERVAGRDHAYAIHAGRASEGDDAQWFGTFGEFYGLTREDHARFVAGLRGVQKLPAVVDWDISALVAHDA